jgi:hypothetical protein
VVVRRRRKGDAIPDLDLRQSIGGDGILHTEDPEIPDGVFVVIYANVDGAHGTVHLRAEHVADGVDRVRRQLADIDAQYFPALRADVIEVRAHPGAFGL